MLQGDTRPSNLCVVVEKQQSKENEVDSNPVSSESQRVAKVLPPRRVQVRLGNIDIAENESSYYKSSS